jgi:hypothetical protein
VGLLRGLLRGEGVRWWVKKFGVVGGLNVKELWFVGEWNREPMGRKKTSFRGPQKTSNDVSFNVVLYCNTSGVLNKDIDFDPWSD